MSKKQIILFRSSTSVETKSTAHRMVTWLNERGLDDYQAVYYQDLVVHLSGATVTAFIAKEEVRPLRAGLVYLHGYSHSDVRQFIAHYCKQKGMPFLNTENVHTMPTSKLNQYYAFSRNKVPYPETVVAYPRNIETAVGTFNYRFPFVLKAIHGRGGEDNFLIRSADQLKMVVKSLPGDQAYAMQPFVDNDGDYRVVVFKKKVVACYKRSRTSETDHRNNVRQGATRELISPIPPRIAKTAIRAAGALKRELTGIDVLIDRQTGKYYVLESNFNFGLKDEGDGIVPYVLERLAPMLHKTAK